jgi:hypothetical protein
MMRLPRDEDASGPGASLGVTSSEKVSEESPRIMLCAFVTIGER